jgi:flagellar hook-associated protein 3 FlgL
MQDIQNQLSSGQEIAKPSDDPFGTIRALNLDTSIQQNDQYLKNIEDSMGWIEATDSALSGMGDVLLRIRELTIYGANGALSDTDLDAISEEIKQNIEQIAEIGNTNFDGRYVFSGQSTTTRPFEVIDNEIVYASNDSGALSREISKDVTIDINVPGTELINSGTEDLSVTLQNVYARMTEGDNTSLSEDSLVRLDEHIEHLLSVRAEVGAKNNRVDSARLRNESENINLTELYSKTMDIDIAEKVMEYSMMEMVYQSSLATGAKILQPTLLDYLR